MQKIKKPAAYPFIDVFYQVQRLQYCVRYFSDYVEDVILLKLISHLIQGTKLCNMVNIFKCLVTIGLHIVLHSSIYYLIFDIYLAYSVVFRNKSSHSTNTDMTKVINMPYIVMEITAKNTCSVTLKKQHGSIVLPTIHI